MRVGIVVLVLFAQAALGQHYPDRPIRLISPNPSDGANDTEFAAFIRRQHELHKRLVAEVNVKLGQ